MCNKSYYTGDISSLKAYDIQVGDIAFVMDTNELYVGKAVRIKERIEQPFRQHL
jgi:hypothetical protein